MKVAGDVCDENGELAVEELELWRRDPIDCIQELIGNPAFKNLLSYTPEQVFRDADGKIRVFDETWTANWWWDLQVGNMTPLWVSELKYLCRKSSRKVRP